MPGQKATETGHRGQRRLRWDFLLAAACVAAASLIIVGFGTGRAENDIMEQARQMLGMKAVSDWHPPVVVALWRGLYALTGSVGSLFAFQIILYYLGIFLTAAFAHRRLGSRLGSVAVLVVSASPWAYSALNTPWKDTIMAAALLVATGAAALAGPRGRKSLLLIMLALAMLVFATLVRKNAIAAVVPICAYIAYTVAPAVASRLGRFAPRKMQGPRKLKGAAAAAVAAVLVVAVGGASAVVDAGIGRGLNVKKTHQAHQVLLDDVLFTIPEDELDSADVPQELKARLNTARTRCYEKGTPYDAYWNCYGTGVDGKYEPISKMHRSGLEKLWTEHVITHPGRYLSYRWRVFEFYLTSSILVYLSTSGPMAKKFGFDQGSTTFNKVSERYVRDFEGGPLHVLFLPLFWAFAGLAAAAIALWAKRNRAVVLMLTSSALLYMAAYFPVVPSNHFRYTYWPALAVSMALIFAVVGGAQRRRPRGVTTPAAVIGSASG